METRRRAMNPAGRLAATAAAVLVCLGTGVIGCDSGEEELSREERAAYLEDAKIMLGQEGAGGLMSHDLLTRMNRSVAVERLTLGNEKASGFPFVSESYLANPDTGMFLCVFALAMARNADQVRLASLTSEGELLEVVLTFPRSGKKVPFYKVPFYHVSPVIGVILKPVAELKKKALRVSPDRYVLKTTLYMAEPVEIPGGTPLVVAIRTSDGKTSNYVPVVFTWDLVGETGKGTQGEKNPQTSTSKPLSSR